jgi:hypothetical protein
MLLIARQRKLIGANVTTDRRNSQTSRSFDWLLDGHSPSLVLLLIKYVELNRSAVANPTLGMHCQRVRA